MHKISLFETEVNRLTRVTDPRWLLSPQAQGFRISSCSSSVVACPKDQGIPSLAADVETVKGGFPRSTFFRSGERAYRIPLHSVEMPS